MKHTSESSPTPDQADQNALPAPAFVPLRIATSETLEVADSLHRELTHFFTLVAATSTQRSSHSGPSCVPPFAGDMGRERKKAGAAPSASPRPTKQGPGTEPAPHLQARAVQEGASGLPAGGASRSGEPRTGGRLKGDPRSRVSPPVPSASRTDPKNRTDLGTHGLQTANGCLFWNLMGFAATPRNTNILQRILAGPIKQPHTIQTVQDPIHIYST